MFSQLDAAKINDTAFALCRRVKSRFPASGLSGVVAELAGVSKETAVLADELNHRNWPLRIAAIVLTLLLAVAIGFALPQLAVPVKPDSATDLAQGLESGINDVIFAGIAIYFAFTIETRRKRKHALALISRLRSLAHVIDMHQLTKDPDQLAGVTDGDGGKPALPPDQLVRYLDYCSESLALLGKLAALCVQRFDDPVTLTAVDQLEDLTNGLSRKIWQKITIVDRFIEVKQGCEEK